MRLCVLALLLGVSLPAAARAQPGVDAAAATILVHPDVPTILQLPDQIERVWFIDDGQLMVQGTGDKVYVRPRPDAPTGLEAYIEVETRTLHRVFLVRVVERAADAMQAIVVPPVVGARCEEEEGRAAPVVPTPAEPPANAPDATPNPASAPEPEPTAPAIPGAGDTGGPRAAAATGPRRFELSAHGLLALGVTRFELVGYEALRSRQTSYALGVRLLGMPAGARWALEANIIGERSAGPMLFTQGAASREVSGPSLLGEVGIRVQTGATWIFSAGTRIGLQAHLRQIVTTGPARPTTEENMPYGAVMTMGLGVHYRSRDLLLGIDFQARRGGLDDYFSASIMWTAGYVLDQGE